MAQGDEADNTLSRNEVVSYSPNMVKRKVDVRWRKLIVKRFSCTDFGFHLVAPGVIHLVYLLALHS